MHVVAWQQDEFKALVVPFIVFDSPDGHLFAQSVPIETVKGAVRIVLVGL